MAWKAAAAAKVLESSLEEIGIPVVRNVLSLATNWTDKVGFDLDSIGRKRRISQIVEQLTIKYGEGKVNIAVWNMHLPENHHFGGLLSSGTSPMGNGGGFCICVFTEMLPSLGFCR